jgi:hypothetical protein
MYIVPTIEDFVNGSYSVAVTDSYYITLNMVNEEYHISGRDVLIRQMNVIAQLFSGSSESQIVCPNVIGLSNDLVSIQSEDPSLNGTRITFDNMGKWGVEINE